MNKSVIAIPFVITFVYALTLTNEYNNVMGDNNSDSFRSQGIFLANTIPTIAVQQEWELDENEPITDLPVIDTPCNPHIRLLQKCASICVNKI